MSSKFGRLLSRSLMLLDAVFGGCLGCDLLVSHGKSITHLRLTIGFAW